MSMNVSEFLDDDVVFSLVDKEIDETKEAEDDIKYGILNDEMLDSLIPDNLFEGE